MNNCKISVVILVYNHWNITQRLLSGLLRHEKDNIDEVLVVDNGSSEPETITGLAEWVGSQNLPIRVLRLEENLGFTLGCNAGLKSITQDIAERKLVFLISNDVQINGKFIQQSADILLGAKRAFVGNRHIDWDSGWNTFNGIVFGYLEGYFLAATSDGWRDLEFFDHNYAPFDMEDIDVSTKAKAKGYKLVSLNNPNIAHQGAGTIGYNPERVNITLRNKEYFRKKWTHE